MKADARLATLPECEILWQALDGLGEGGLDGLEKPRLVVPDAVAAHVVVASVVTRRRPAARAAALGGLLAEPHALLARGHQRDGQAHPVRAPHAADAVDVVLGLVGQRHVDHEGQPHHVDAARPEIGADEEAHVAVLEVLQVGAALFHGPPRPQHHARVGVLAALLGLAAEGAAAAQRVEVALQVVAVEVGAAEDDGMLHAQLVHELDEGGELEALDAFGAAEGAGVGRPQLAGALVGKVHLVGGVGVHGAPRGVGHGVHLDDEVVDGGGHVVAALEVHPRGVLAQNLGQLADLGGVQRRGEEQHLEALVARAVLAQALEDVHDGGAVARLEQAVRLVQHQVPHLGAAELAACHELLEPARRRHNHVRAGLERADVVAYVRAAHRQHHLESWGGHELLVVDQAARRLLRQIA
mmetsp:Transcript_70765/g.188913  ORF Transcript_70765/g.188913 Transcript_70765/m.188913 type:complete len:412 (-) Transcript_70765:863-2098(-)